MQEVFSRKNELQINDSSELYLNDIQRIANPRYLPTTDDVLRSRVRTTVRPARKRAHTFVSYSAICK